MKTREIDVWVTKTNDYKNDMWRIDLHGKELRDDRWVKAKLIIPVESEVIEFESLIVGRGIVEWPCINNEEAAAKLIGKRWRIVATEVVV